MILIIGGAYQGKLTYALKKYSVSESEVFDLSLGDPSARSRIFTHFESYSKRAALSGMPFEEFIKAFLLLANDSIVISREAGSGIVPIDENERYWREYHGRALRELAGHALKLTRVFCGLPEEIK